MEFILTATNLDDSNTSLIIESGITNQYRIFTIEDITSCDFYSFQVVATNGGGSSRPSDSITSNFPSLPDISPIKDSLYHSLVKTVDGVILNVTFDVRLLYFPSLNITI